MRRRTSTAGDTIAAAQHGRRGASRAKDGGLGADQLFAAGQTATADATAAPWRPAGEELAAALQALGLAVDSWQIS